MPRGRPRRQTEEATPKAVIPDHAKRFLFSLDGKHEPQDGWIILPPQGGHMNTDEYKQYKSDQLLSTGIKVESSVFAKHLWSKKGSRQTEENYLRDRFGFRSIVKVRKKVTYVNYREGADKTMAALQQATQSLMPAFCQEAISDLNTDIAEGGKFDESTFFSFMENLHVRSKDYRHHIPTMVSSLQQVTKLVIEPNDAVEVFLNDKSTLCPIVEDDNKPVLSVNTILLSPDSSTACNFNPALPVISPTESESGSGIEVIANAALPVISPTESESGSGIEVIANDENTNESNFNFDTGNSSGESNKRMFVIAEQLLSGLKAQFPKKSAKTVEQFESTGELVWKPLDMSTGFAKKGADYKLNQDIIDLMMHAISNQDTKRSIQLLVSWIEACPDRLSWAETVLTALASKNKTNRQVAQRIAEKANANNQSTDKEIVDSLKCFLNSFPTGGTRKKSTQEAINAVHTASLYNVSVDALNKAKARLGIRKEAADKTSSRVVQSSTDNKKYYAHDERKVRCDNKRLASKPFVEEFCHANCSYRAAKVDTGEFTNVKVKNADGVIETHPRRRWIDASKKSHVYDMWKKSEFAAQFAEEHPELGTIGYTIFWDNACPCVKFGTKDMCSDLIMTGLEEAARGWEKAMKCKHVKNMFNLCQCELHNELRKRKPIGENSAQSCNNDDDSDDGSIAESINSDDEYLRLANSALGLRNDCDDDGPIWLSSYIRQQGEDMIYGTCCAAKEYPELAKCRVPGDRTDMKTPSLVHPDCISVCKDCGVERLFPAFDQCPMLFPEEESDGRKVRPLHMFNLVHHTN
jgi:hypothetical protein